jgi:addiction module RelB/DinJ family antitoxin
MKTKIELYIDEEVFKSASQVFESIGMDLQMAVNVFLRRTASEKAFPLSMVAPVAAPEQSYATGGREKTQPTQRVNNSITQDMVEDVWHTFVRLLRDNGEINRLSDETSKRTGMTRGSAFIYLCILNNLVNGEYNTRNMKVVDLEYYLNKIKAELGAQSFSNALSSLEQSIPYWRDKIPGAFADNVEALIRSMR